MNLHDYLFRSAAAYGSAVAIEEVSGASISYRALADLAGLVRQRLIAAGVGPGDRVGIYLHKSIDGVAAIFGVLEAGAAYVPLDPTAPIPRNAFIIADCAVKVLIVEQSFAAALALPPRMDTPMMIVLEHVGGGQGLAQAIRALPGADAEPARRVSGGALAYLLYTSGSTGVPKGVMLSHENGVSFVEWCCQTFGATHEDRLASHAPFNFDLSIHDIFVSVACGGVLLLLPEDLAKEAPLLAKTIADKRVTVWYSVPYILGLMAQFGRFSSHDYSALRMVLFAGEVFPIPQLRALCTAWPQAAYYNLYGPTETNVCAHFEVDLEDLKERSEPLPLGKLCPHLRGLVVDEQGEECADEVEGELCVSGANVLMGYWGLAEQTERAFLQRPGRFYRTGDIVVRERDGSLRFVGRRDRMVKKRGYRVELVEIETCLQSHPQVREAAVVASNSDAGVMITATLSSNVAERLSIMELRSYCAKRLPVYMIPDRFAFCASLPRTATQKVDYPRLSSASTAAR